MTFPHWKEIEFTLESRRKFQFFTHDLQGLIKEGQKGKGGDGGRQGEVTAVVYTKEKTHKKSNMRTAGCGQRMVKTQAGENFKKNTNKENPLQVMRLATQKRQTI